MQLYVVQPHTLHCTQYLISASIHKHPHNGHERGASVS